MAIQQSSAIVRSYSSSRPSWGRTRERGPQCWLGLGFAGYVIKGDLPGGEVSDEDPFADWQAAADFIASLTDVTISLGVNQTLTLKGMLQGVAVTVSDRALMGVGARLGTWPQSEESAAQAAKPKASALASFGIKAVPKAEPKPKGKATPKAKAATELQAEDNDRAF